MPGIKNFYLPLARVHIQADRWQDAIGTDYWMEPALLAGTTVAGSNRLIDNGWTLEAEHGVAGSGGDFLGGTLTGGNLYTPADASIPPHFAHLASGDLVVSPPVFGTWHHAWAAMRVAGKSSLPTKLVMEVIAAFNVHSADEPTSGFGLFEDSVTTTSATENTQVAFISSNSTSFELNSNAAGENAAVVLQADDALYHIFKIELRRDTAAVAKAYAYIDNVLLGSIPITEDEAPYSFGSHTLTTNRLQLGTVHIYYDW